MTLVHVDETVKTWTTSRQPTWVYADDAMKTWPTWWHCECKKRQGEANVNYRCIVTIREHWTPHHGYSGLAIWVVIQLSLFETPSLAAWWLMFYCVNVVSNFHTHCSITSIWKEIIITCILWLVIFILHKYNIWYVYW